MGELNQLVDDLIHSLIFINAFLYAISFLLRKNSRSTNWLVLYLVIGFFLQFYMYHLNINSEYNLWVAHIYFAFQFVVLSLFYKEMFFKKQQQIVMFTGLSVFLILIYYYSSDTSRLSTFNLLDIFVTMVPIIAYSIIHLYNSLTTKSRFLLINGSVLIYFSTSTLIFFVSTFFMVEGITNLAIKKLGSSILDINNFLFLLYQITILLEWKLNISKWKT